MKNFVGIDLGTTNSAICTYDGSETRIWKSPEVNDVTPSAIYINRKGHKHVGQRAYDLAPRSPGNAATLFKRLMGTGTPVELSGAGVTLTPGRVFCRGIKSVIWLSSRGNKERPGYGHCDYCSRRIYPNAKRRHHAGCYHGGHW